MRFAIVTDAAGTVSGLAAQLADLGHEVELADAALPRDVLLAAREADAVVYPADALTTEHLAAMLAEVPGIVIARREASVPLAWLATAVVEPEGAAALVEEATARPDPDIARRALGRAFGPRLASWGVAADSPALAAVTRSLDLFAGR